jgi:hypothetical protein
VPAEQCVRALEAPCWVLFWTWACLLLCLFLHPCTIMVMQDASDQLVCCGILCLRQVSVGQVENWQLCNTTG